MAFLFTPLGTEQDTKDVINVFWEYNVLLKLHRKNSQYLFELRRTDVMPEYMETYNYRVCLVSSHIRSAKTLCLQISTANIHIHIYSSFS